MYYNPKSDNTICRRSNQCYDTTTAAMEVEPVYSTNPPDALDDDVADFTVVPKKKKKKKKVKASAAGSEAASDDRYANEQFSHP
jgi:hypothetical protein